MSCIKTKNNGSHNCSLKTEYRWMTAREAAAYLGLSYGALRTKISRGEIPVQGKLGRSLRFRREELDRLLEFPIGGGFNG